MITWHERAYGNLIASDDTGKVIGRVSLVISSGFYRTEVEAPYNLLGEYLSKECAKAAVERASKPGELT